jgi:hypothetical protein
MRLYSLLGAVLIWAPRTGLPAVTAASAQDSSPPSALPARFRLPRDYDIDTGGQYRVIGHATNFTRHPDFIGGDQDSASLLNLRLRQWLGIRNVERDDHGAYVQVEYGHLELGAEEEFTKDDQTVELRRGYLWLRPEEEQLLRVGLVDWQDRFGERPSFGAPYEAIDACDHSRAVLANSVWDFNVGGAVFDGKLGTETWYRAAVVLLGPGDHTISGDGTAVLWAADLDRQAGKHLLGVSAYYLHDNADYSYGTFGGPGADYDSSWDAWLGVRAHFDCDGLRSSFFVICNHGETDDPDWEHSGYAWKAALETSLSEGVLALQALGSTGNDGSDPNDSDEFRTIAQSERDNFGAQGYWSNLAITSPRGSTDNNDLGVSVQNRGLGLYTLQGSYDQPLTEHLRGNLAAGWLRAAEESTTREGTSIGLEVAAELQWRPAGSMVVQVGAAQLFTGDFYEAPGSGSPDDLQAFYVRMQLEF